MAYTIVKTDGTILTTIADGTINTTSTSLGLPGRNYAGYGQQIDTNFVHAVENFASPNPPVNALRGQLWFNTNTSTLLVCPTDGETNAGAWLALTSTSSGGTTTFAQVNVTGNVTANNVTSNNAISAQSATVQSLTVSATSTLNTVNISNNLSVSNTFTVANITTGAANTPGNITGTFTVSGGNTGTALTINGGNLIIPNVASAGIKTDNYYWANGTPVSFAGSYGNSNVAAYLPTYAGNLGGGTATFYGNVITTGANITAGSITGNWTLTNGSRMQATYADLAERFSADDVYDAGTVVSLGGTKEITAVQYELSEDVFGVISTTAAYLMNSAAGDDNTHPAVAVSGRVPVKVSGKVAKGERLVSAGEGLARAASVGEATSFNVIGRALVDKTDDAIGYVEAFVSIN